MRFADPNKWRDPWFRPLKGVHKLVFLYLIDNCNNAGFYEIDYDMMSFQMGIERNHIDGALKALTRGIKGAGGWLWVKRYLRHQKNEDLNPNNPAHRQIIAQIREQESRFQECPEFQEFIAPYKGLLSPIGKVLVQVQKKEVPSSFNKPTREEAHIYAEEIGLSADRCDSWYDHFESNGWRVSGRTQMRDWKAAMRNAKRSPIQFVKPPEKKFKVV